MATLTANTMVRHPGTGEPVTLVAGTELPDWAGKAKLVGEHLLAGDTEADYPEGDPTSSWKAGQLKAYAADHGIDLGGARTKDDILTAIEAHGPDQDSGDDSEDPDEDPEE